MNAKQARALTQQTAGHIEEEFLKVEKAILAAILTTATQVTVNVPYGLKTAFIAKLQERGFTISTSLHNRNTITINW